MQHFAAHSAEASHLRRRKYALVRQFGLPESLVGGCLCQTHRRCGRHNYHCANGRGHSMWSITFSRRGKRRVERVPLEWVEELEQAVLSTKEYLNAVKEVMAINIELLALTRRQQLSARRTSGRKKTKKQQKRLEKRSTFPSAGRS